MRRKLLSALLCICMIFPLAGELVLPVKAYSESSWVEASLVPDGAEITDRKWTYTKTTYQDSRETSLSGYTLVSSEWVKSGSGSQNYAAFPSGFDTSHSIYTSFYRSSSAPYTASETATAKRTVSNTWGGYVYWHWMYDTNQARGTSTRAIYNKKGTGPDNGFYYKYFGAFTSTAGNYSSDRYYCNSTNTLNYIIPERTAYADCQGATRWFRFSYQTSTYTDYYKLFHYKKVEQLESSTEITTSSSSTVVISDVKELVKYKESFTISYDANGGTNAPAAQTKQLNVPLTITSDKPVRSGYLFMGWSVSNSAIAASYQPGDSFVSNGDYTLYAVWQNATKYTVTYDCQTNGGTACSVQAISVFQDEAANLQITAEKEGWEFVGWNTDPTATTALSGYTVTADTTLYAIFRKTATASLYVGEQILYDRQPQTFYNLSEGQTITLPQIPNYNDWTASAWMRSTDKQEFKPGDSVLISDDVQYYAKYVKTLYLMYDANGGKTEPNHQKVQLYYLADGTFEQKQPVLAAPIERDGFSFDKWAYGSESGEKYSAGDTLFLKETVVMYATWTQLEVLQMPQWEVRDIPTGVEVVLNSQENAPVYYTLDGTTPTTASALYETPIRLETAGEYSIKALAIQNGFADSSLMVGTVELKATEAPTADLADGYIQENDRITLSVFDGGTIYYTTDGTEPTQESSIYTTPITIPDNCTLKAIAARAGYAQSACVTYQYRLAPVYAVDVHGYDFSNQAFSFGYTDTSPNFRNYCIPYNSVKYIFGDSVKGKSVYTSMARYPWSGNCCGMASTSALLFSLDTEIAASDFGQNHANDLEIGSIAAAYDNLTLKSFIEAMQVAQYTVQFDQNYSQNKIGNSQLHDGGNLNELYNNVKQHLARNKNDIIAVGMSGVGAHALLAYRMEDVSATESRLYIYDCNKPDNADCYVRLWKDSDGNVTGWSYDMGGYGIWGSETSRNCYISYIPFDTVQFIWNNRGKLYDNYLTLTVSSGNVAIYDLNNELVGRFVDGELYTDRTDVYAIPNLSLSVESDYSVYLPEDFYIVSNQAEGTFEATMVSESLGATVSTDAETVCFAIDEDSQMNDISIEQASTNETYTISLDSNYYSGSETVFRNVTISGTGVGDTLQVSSNALGGLSVSNCTIGSYKINGVEQIQYSITASAGKGGTLSQTGDVSVPAGEDKTFTIIPDLGYRIKDVMVDGYSIGPTTEYTFEKVGKDHMIRVVFEPLYTISKVELSDQSVVATLNNDEAINICAAVYSAEGKIEQIVMVPIGANAGTVEIPLAGTLPQRYEIRVFLLKKNTMEPLADYRSLYSN